MLWLMRQVRKSLDGERCCVVFDLPNGERIRVWVQSCGDRSSISLAIDAPKDVVINRGELLDAEVSEPPIRKAG